MREVATIRAKLDALRPYLDELRRRLWAPAGPMALRRGWIMASATGLHRATTLEIRGPSSERRMVEAWSDHYIHFERRTACQDQLHAELRNRVQILFFGQRQPFDFESTSDRQSRRSDPPVGSR